MPLRQFLFSPRLSRIPLADGRHDTTEKRRFSPRAWRRNASLVEKSVTESRRLVGLRVP
jgi:hypothetical protein